MLNIILAMIIGYVFFTLIACGINLIIRYLLKCIDLSYSKVIQISNAGFGASLMVTFLAMMFIPQFDISPEEKTLYLFYTFAGSYLIILLISFYSQLTYQPEEKNNSEIEQNELDAESPSQVKQNRKEPR